MKFLMLLALSATPGAGENPVRLNSMFCEIVNGYVDIYGEKAAATWAKSHKWSAARIAEAKGCRGVRSS